MRVRFRIRVRVRVGVGARVRVRVRVRVGVGVGARVRVSNLARQRCTRRVVCRGAATHGEALRLELPVG